MDIDILLVEDNPEDIELSIRALKKGGITSNIFVVNEGEDALDFIYCRNKFHHRKPEQTPKIILLDLKLPRISGIEVLRVIKEDQKKKMIPVIVLTSSSEEKDMMECYKLGVNSYIQKPIDFDKFISAINQIGSYWLFLNRIPEFSKMN